MSDSNYYETNTFLNYKYDLQLFKIELRTAFVFINLDFLHSIKGP